MKKNLFISTLLMLPNLVIAANTTITWGVQRAAPTFLVGDSSQDFIDSVANPGLVTLGYFSDSLFDVSSNSNNLGSIFDNFVSLDVASPKTGTVSGLFESSVSLEVDSSGIAGESLYYWVLPDITNYDRDSVLLASEHGIFRDSSWGVVPTGSSPVPTAYNITSLSLDTILVGETISGAGAFGGDLYITAAVVPEPSTYAAIFGVLVLGLAIYRRRNNK